MQRDVTKEEEGLLHPSDRLSGWARQGLYSSRPFLLLLLLRFTSLHYDVTRKNNVSGLAVHTTQYMQAWPALDKVFSVTSKRAPAFSRKKCCPAEGSYVLAERVGLSQNSRDSAAAMVKGLG